MAIRIGISGWRYEPWRGVFYPDDLKQKRELEFASRALNTIEINGTFYSLQRPHNFQQWREETPSDFVFAVKGGRFITHLKRLREIETPLANFFASGVLCMNEKLGPFLWQFPPNFKYDEARFDHFLGLLPHTSGQAAEMARGHDKRLKGRSWTKTNKDRPIRHAIEIRHSSFECAEFVALLRKHKVALVLADTAGKWPYFEDLTSDFVYCRLHGAEELYSSGYTEPALDWWAARIDRWKLGGEPPDARRVAPPLRRSRKSRDVYVYFDNDIKVKAPFDAQRLAKKLGVKRRPPLPK